MGSKRQSINYEMGDKRQSLTSAVEQDMIDRRMVAWVNTYPDFPEDLLLSSPTLPISYEHLAADTVSVAFSNIQSTKITQKYILGGYKAEYKFSLIYRIKPGLSNDKRLLADEFLNRIGDWMVGQKPDIGDGLQVLSIEPDTRSALVAKYEDGDEDHQILCTMTYERV